MSHVCGTSYQRRAARAALVVRRKAAGEQKAHSRAKTLSAAAPYINVSVKYVKVSSDQRSGALIDRLLGAGENSTVGEVSPEFSASP